MVRGIYAVLIGNLLAVVAVAQDDPWTSGYVSSGYLPVAVSSGEPLFSFDDQEPWKHGYIQPTPFYGGYHKFRPYNYKHVFSQSQTAAGWGMPNTMPYSQQFWHRYERRADLSQPRILPSPVVPPGGVTDPVPPLGSRPELVPPGARPAGWAVSEPEPRSMGRALPPPTSSGVVDQSGPRLP